MSTTQVEDIKSRQELADLMEMTAEELERRAQALLKRARELSSGAITLRAADDRGDGQPTEEEFRSVSRTGDVVTEAVAIQTVTELKKFTHADFCSTLGLTRAQGRRWITKLMNRKYPIIERTDDGVYAYVQPPSTVKARNQQVPPEVKLIDRGAKDTRGAPVSRRPSERARREDLSKPGRGHQLRQADKVFDRVQAARASRNGKG